MQTKLLVPLLKDKSYDMRVDLCHSKEAGHFVDWEYFLPYDTPAKLRVFGGGTSCDKTQLLWESPLIDHIDWKEYEITLQPRLNDIHYLIFEAVYAKDSTYFVNVLIDNISISLCGIATPIKTISFDSSVCEGEALIINASTPGGSYQWNTGSTEPSIMAYAGTYQVEVSNGCETETFQYNVQEKECNCEIVIPNVFTPNGDSFNEFFEITGTKDIARFDLKIYNRWGQLVYGTNEINDYWSGDLSGRSSSPGPYYWTIKLMCIKGNTIIDRSLKGVVTILDE